MKIIEIEISKIVPYARNQKEHTPKQIKQVAASIKRFGFIQPIVVDKGNEIVIGHCRYEGAKLLGMETVPCVMADNLSAKEIKALRLADNKLNESAWDMKMVIGDLKDLDSMDLVDITGFSRDLLLDMDNEASKRGRIRSPNPETSRASCHSNDQIIQGRRYSARPISRKRYNTDISRESQ